MIDEQLKILRQIQENTAPAPRQVFIAKKQEELIDEAGKVPVKLLLGIPLVFGGLLPFLFENGSDLDLSLSALLTTFFLLFFVVPVMLVVFRAHDLGFAKLAVYALGFAAMAYAVDLIAARWLRVPAIVILAVVFGMGPHLLASGGIPAPLRALRRLRDKRDPASDPAAPSTGTTAASAEPGAQQDFASSTPEPEVLSPSEKPLIAWSGVFGRENRRVNPERRFSLLCLSLASTAGILLLFMAPRSAAESKWGLVRLDTLVSPREYANAAEFVRDVRHADTRQKHTAKLRARDESALQFLPLERTFWDSAIELRLGLMAPQSVIEAAARVNPGSPDPLLDWVKDATWDVRLDSAHAHRDHALADSGGVAAREAFALNLAQRLAAARDTFRTTMEPRLALPLDREVVPDSAALEAVRTMETVAATLRAGRAEQQAALVAASEQLAGEQRQIFVMMNNKAQERLATAVNNARVVGIWLFAAALLIMAVGLATDPARSRKPEPESETPEREKPALREGDRHLRSAYVLGCSLMGSSSCRCFSG